MKLLMLLLISALFITPAWPLNVQVRDSDKFVMGSNDRSLAPLPGHTIVVVPGTQASFAWPIPAGCTRGLNVWSRYVSGNTFDLRPGLTTFASTIPTLLAQVPEDLPPQGCVEVQSWRELLTVVQKTIIAAVNSNPLFMSMASLNAIAMLGTCPVADPDSGGALTSNTTATCNSARTTMTTINNISLGATNVLPTPAAVNTFLGHILTLINDAVKLKQDKGW